MNELLEQYYNEIIENNNKIKALAWEIITEHDPFKQGEIIGKIVSLTITNNSHLEILSEYRKEWK